MEKAKDLFYEDIRIEDNLVVLSEKSVFSRQEQTTQIYNEKWEKAENINLLRQLEEFQKDWYLKLYGFKDVEELSFFLKSKPIIFDAGCGMGYKSAWFAGLAPDSLVMAMDYSDSVYAASRKYRGLSNLIFIRGDIADTKIRENSIDYVNCDQVIHHTEKPENTFRHLAGITKPGGEFACYVYAKKALPRELLDEHFRTHAGNHTREELWDLSKALTLLGKTLSELHIEIDVPDIPLLQIRGGKQDLQRFVYWNFLKCFWNQKLGFDTSVHTNFDWYAPSNARRYSEDEFRKLISDNHLTIRHFHREEACFSGRFAK